ncbi:MAG: 50S ribosomal protein L18 [Chloroflexi bacterium]|nr:50S ribosomal protein L18 [Chloroflexota bacterium]
MFKRVNSRAARLRRHLRVRRKVSGTAERPRLAVFRSANHIYAQVIDDTTHATLASASTLDPELRSSGDGKPKAEQAKQVGTLVAQRARQQGISRVVFDRGGYIYHGRIKAVAEGARSEGLEF